MRLFHSLSLGVSALVLAGCVTVLPDPVVPDGLYRLTNSNGMYLKSTPVDLPANITVFEPSGSDLLLSKDIVYEDQNGALSLISKARWGETMSRQMQSALIDRLMEGVPDGARRGVAMSDRLGAVADYELQWEVRDAVIRDDSVAVSIRGLVSSFKTGKVVPLAVDRTADYSGQPEDEGVMALIETSQKALNDIAERLPDLMTQVAGD